MNHIGCKTSKYHSPRDLFILIRQLIAIVTHIALDCQKFMNCNEVTQIRLKVDEYAEKVENLRRRLKDCAKSTQKEYRKKYLNLIKDIKATRNDLMNDEVIKHSYADKLLSSHLMDMSIIHNEKDIYEFPVSQIIENASKFQSEIQRRMTRNDSSITN